MGEVNNKLDIMNKSRWDIYNERMTEALNALMEEGYILKWESYDIRKGKAHLFVYLRAYHERAYDRVCLAHNNIMKDLGVRMDDPDIIDDSCMFLHCAHREEDYEMAKRRELEWAHTTYQN